MENLQQTHSPHFLSQTSFCVFDLETTGGNHKSDKIIEIGLVKIKNLKIESELTYLIDPEIPIPDFIQKLTSIRSKKVKGMPRIEDVIDSILQFMGDSILVAHNASFDVPFFNSVLTRLDLGTLPNKSICTNIMTKYLIPEIMNSNLNYMSQIFGIEHSKAHRALEDAKATAKLFLTYLNFFIEKKIRKINHLYYPKNKYELDRLHIRSYLKETIPESSQESPSSLEDPSALYCPREEILDSLSKLSSSATLTLKGDQGKLMGVFPLESPQEEAPQVLKLIEGIPFHLATIKMANSFLDGLFNLNTQWMKLTPELREKTLNYLWEKSTNLSSDQINQESHDSKVFQEFDFIVTPHLIPEQFVIYPLLNFNKKNGLIFRYPSHKKKLLQFINSQLRKLKVNQLDRSNLFFDKKLLDLSGHFIQRQMELKTSKYFFFHKDSFYQKNKDLMSEMEQYFRTNSKTTNYPIEHI